MEIYGRHGDKWSNIKDIKEYYTDNVAYVKIGNELPDKIILQNYLETSS